MFRIWPRIIRQKPLVCSLRDFNNFHLKNTTTPLKGSSKGAIQLCSRFSLGKAQTSWSKNHRIVLSSFISCERHLHFTQLSKRNSLQRENSIHYAYKKEREGEGENKRREKEHRQADWKEMRDNLKATVHFQYSHKPSSVMGKMHQHAPLDEVQSTRSFVT